MKRTLLGMGGFCLVLVSWAPLSAQGPAPAAPLGVIQGLAPEQARQAAMKWLRATPQGATHVATAEAWWQPSDDRPILEKIAATLALGDPAIAKGLATLRSPDNFDPSALVAEVQSTPRAPFAKQHWALILARGLVNRRFHEEALTVLKLTQPEQCADPAGYYFTKAVAANRLRMKDEALAAIHRLSESVKEAPERYLVVAGLMRDEMAAWQEKDLGEVARRMEEVEGRLETARGGAITQQKQKEIIDLLDKKIDDIEQQLQQMQQQAQAGGRAPQPSTPADDSRIMQAAGEGKVANKKFIKDGKNWGGLPDKEKGKAMEAVSRELPAHIREAVEGYNKIINAGKK